MSPTPSTDRIDVRKTAKLYIGGAFPRSESGHSYEVTDAKGKFVANAALASRKDARDAVVAARNAFHGWSGRTAYNRGQILYRVAEMLEDRRAQFVAAVSQAEGLTAARADKVVDATVDRLVWYAGWADKITQVVGNANPVAGPFFNLSTPEPTGVVAVLAPQGSSLLGLVSVIAPTIVTGNTVVVVTSHERPLPAVALERGSGDVRPPRRRGQPADRLGGDDRAVARRAPGRQRDRPHRRRRRRRALHRSRALRCGQPQAGPARTRRRAGLVGRPWPPADDRLPGDEDGLAPDGCLRRTYSKAAGVAATSSTSAARTASTGRGSRSANRTCTTSSSTSVTTS